MKRFIIILLCTAVFSGLSAKDSVKTSILLPKCLHPAVKLASNNCSSCKVGQSGKTDKFVDKNKNGICDERECCLGTKKCFTSGKPSAK